MKERSKHSSVLSGSLWSIALRWSMRLIGLVSLVLLARLLTPADYGIAAAASVLYGLLETVSYAGVDLALLRIANPSKDDYDTAWTIQLLQGGFVAAILVFAALFLPNLYGDPRLTGVLLALAGCALIEGLQSIGIVNFRRSMNFQREFRFEMFKKCVVFCTLVSSAYLLRSYWAFTLGQLAGALYCAIASYRYDPYRPNFSLRSKAKLLSFSIGMMIGRVGQFLNRKLDVLILGGGKGSSAMGLYYVSQELAAAPTSEVVMPIRRVLFPALSNHVESKQAFDATVVQFVGAALIVCFGLGFGLCATAQYVVPIFLGSAWSDAIPILQWLAVLGVFVGILSLIELPLWVRGKTGLTARLVWCETAITLLVLIAVLPRYGAIGAAVTRTAIAAAMVPIYLHFASRLSVFSVRPIIEQFSRVLACAFVMLAAVHWLAPKLHGLATPAQMAISTIFGALVYGAMIFSLWRLCGTPEGGERFFIDSIKDFLRKRSIANRA